MTLLEKVKSHQEEQERKGHLNTKKHMVSEERGSGVGLRDELHASHDKRHHPERRGQPVSPSDTSSQDEQPKTSGATQPDAAVSAPSAESHA